MKKKSILVLLAVAALSMTACSGKGGNTESPELTSEENGGVIKNEYGTVELGTYKGVEANKEKVSVTDQDISDRINMLVEEHAEEKEYDKAIEDGNVVYATIDAKADGSKIEDFGDEETAVSIGDASFGEEFDEALKGHKKGDTVKFSVKYDKDFMFPSLAGKKVDYVVKISVVNKIYTPELNDDFIINTLGYASEQDMKDKIKAEIEEELEADALYNMQLDVIGKIVAASKITDYPQEMYDKHKKLFEEDCLMQAQMYGIETLEEFYETAEMTEDDIKSEITARVHEEIVIRAIAEKEGMSVSDEDFDASVKETMEEDGYETEEDFFEAYGGEDNVRYLLLQNMVYEFIGENAVVTEVEPQEDEKTDLEDLNTTEELPSTEELLSTEE